MKYNTFRAIDAFEYTDAYRSAVLQSEGEIRDRLRCLNDRLAAFEKQGNSIRSSLLAAYRGYEDALLFVTNKTVPSIVKLDDTDPTDCTQG